MANNKVKKTSEEKEWERKVVKVQIKDLYQLLLGDTRYAETRYHTSARWGAFSKCRQYLPAMIKVDLEWGLHTAKQLCEEAISALEWMFYYGDDERYGDRKEYLDFIKWLLDFLQANADENGMYRLPYNVDGYYRNLTEDDRPHFLVYHLDGSEKVSELRTKNNYMDYIFEVAPEAAKFEPNSLLYRSETVDVWEENDQAAVIYKLLDAKDNVIAEYKCVNMDRKPK